MSPTGWARADNTGVCRPPPVWRSPRVILLGARRCWDDHHRAGHFVKEDTRLAIRDVRRRVALGEERGGPDEECRCDQRDFHQIPQDLRIAPHMLRRFHWIVGFALLAVFLLTGQYMDKVHAHLAGMADGPRLLYRSRHIYVLMSALLNIALAAYLVPYPHRLARGLQLGGSTIVTAAGVAMVVAFFYDAPHADFAHLTVWWSRGAIFGLVAGVLMHAGAGAISRTHQHQPLESDAWDARAFTRPGFGGDVSSRGADAIRSDEPG